MSRALGSMLAASLLGGVGSAWAADLDVPAGTEEWRAGDLLFDQVTIAGLVKVSPNDGVSQDTGWLRLRADRIEITAAGEIEADARGYPSSTTGGNGYESGAGQTVASPTGLAPGGGGAHYGAGGIAVVPESGCFQFETVAGGTAYDTEPDPFGLSSIGAVRLGGMGSAGGAGQAADGTTVGTGGNGGGLIILEAAEIVLDGLLTANGATPPLTAQGAGTFGVPAGGGAGGTIIVISNAFSMGDAAQCSARGGAGALESLPPESAQAQGGGGGGGRIVLMVGAAHHDAHFDKLDVRGGEEEDEDLDLCTNGPIDGPHGGDGLAQIIDAPACADADLDGFGAPPCGMDCDDTDGSIHPDANESCDGVDENCNGEIDEQLWTDPDAGAPDGGTAPKIPAVCDEGFGYVCVDAQCTPLVTGKETPTGRLRLGGGLCSARPGALASGGAAGLLLGLLLALGLRRRRGTEAPEQRLR